jgi:hypothetical protein
VVQEFGDQEATAPELSFVWKVCRVVAETKESSGIQARVEAHYAGDDVSFDPVITRLENQLLDAGIAPAGKDRTLISKPP